MTNATLGILSLIPLVILLALRVPIAVALMVVGFGGYAYVAGFDKAVSLWGVLPFSEVASYTLTVLPLFIIMGSFSSLAGLAHDLFEAGNKWLGRLPGGLAMATVAACAGFAALCGSSVATAASIGKVAIPQMKRFGYSDTLATGCLASAGTLGILIPPSALMVIYGFVTDTSIGKLLIAGIIPGILTAVVDMGLIYTWARVSPGAAPLSATVFTWKERFSSLLRVWQVVVTAVILIGGIYSGIMTPTEAGAAGAFVTFVLFLTSRNRTWHGFVESLLDTGKTTCMVMWIIVGAFTFSAFISYVNMPAAVANAIASVNIPPLGIVLLFMLMYIFLGCFMEGMSMVLVTMPVVFPVVMKLGFDPVWFGILIVKMVEIGQITPPVAVNIYTVKGVAPDVPLESIIKGIGMFFCAEAVTVTLLLLFPQITLWLPNQMT